MNISYLGQLQELVLASSTGGGCSVGVVRSRTKATELVS
jgi:hypothetical protein